MEFRCISGRQVASLKAPAIFGFEWIERHWSGGALGWYQPFVDDGSVYAWEDEDWLLLAMGEPGSDWSHLESWSSSEKSGRGIDPVLALVQAAQHTNEVCSIVAIDRSVGRICVCSDNLGVRPWFWNHSHTGLVVATTRRAVRALADLAVDPIGVFQMTQAGFTLGSRSTLAGARRNLPGQVLIYPSMNETLSTCTVGTRSENQQTAARELAQQFNVAVESRAARQILGPTRAFLSGGLDSRVIVASLANAAITPKTYSLTLSQSADVTLARQFAARLDLDFTAIPFMPDRRILWAGRLRRVLEDFESLPPDSHAIAWSGDGGSVCVGGVYVSQHMTTLLKNAHTDPQSALDALGLRIPHSILRRESARLLEQMLVDDLRSELARIQNHHGEITAYRFFVDNDQRQHLDTHFENWTEHRIQFLLPFYDRRVVTMMAAQPETWIEFHGIYELWLDILPSIVTALPYQTYPGHPSSHIPVPSESEDQFSTHVRQSFKNRISQQNLTVFMRWIREGCPRQPLLSSMRILLAGIVELIRPRSSSGLMLLHDLYDPEGFGGIEIDPRFTKKGK